MKNRSLTCLAAITALAILGSGVAHGAVLAGWHAWADPVSAYDADVLEPGFTASITQSSDGVNPERVHALFGSTDNSFGSQVAGASDDTPALLVYNRYGMNVLTLSITNATGQDYSIDSLHFDFAPRQETSGTGVNEFTLTYVSGGLGSPGAQIDAQSGLPYVILALDGAVSDYPDYDYTLSDFLADTILADGETATFTLAFSGGNRESTSGAVDNVAFVGSEVPEPTTMSLLGIGAVALLRRRK